MLLSAIDYSFDPFIASRFRVCLAPRGQNAGFLSVSKLIALGVRAQPRFKCRAPPVHTQYQPTAASPQRAPAPRLWSAPEAPRRTAEPQIRSSSIFQPLSFQESIPTLRLQKNTPNFTIGDRLWTGNSLFFFFVFLNCITSCYTHKRGSEERWMSRQRKYLT